MHRVRLEPFLTEGLGTAAGTAAGDCGVGDGFGAGPVTDPVCVADPEENVNSCI